MSSLSFRFYRLCQLLDPSFLRCLRLNKENNFSDSSSSGYAVEVEEEEREFPRADNSAKSADENSSVDDVLKTGEYT